MTPDAKKVEKSMRMQQKGQVPLGRNPSISAYNGQDFIHDLFFGDRGVAGEIFTLKLWKNLVTKLPVIFV